MMGRMKTVSNGRNLIVGRRFAVENTSEKVTFGHPSGETFPGHPSARPSLTQPSVGRSKKIISNGFAQ
ncbi:hypothetical protein BH10PLA1_BH10PLA1_20240 [soil metagenome]